MHSQQLTRLNFGIASLKSSEMKGSDSHSIEPLLCSSVLQEWRMGKEDIVTHVSFVLDREIICYLDKDQQYHLKIIKDRDVQSLTLPTSNPFGKVLAYSENLLLCVEEDKWGFATQCYLLDLSHHKFIAKLDLPEFSKVIGLLKNVDGQKILTVHRRVTYDEFGVRFPELTVHDLTFYKFDQFHKPFLSSELVPRFIALNKIRKNYWRALINATGEQLVLQTHEDIHFHKMDAKDELISCSSTKLAKSSWGYEAHSILNGNYIVGRRQGKDHNMEMQIFDKEFKRIAYCHTSAGYVEQLHMLSDNKTCIMILKPRIEDSCMLIGSFKHDKDGQLPLNLYQLPLSTKKFVVDERHARLICVTDGGIHFAINDFAPIRKMKEHLKTCQPHKVVI